MRQKILLVLLLLGLLQCTVFAFDLSSRDLAVRQTGGIPVVKAVLDLSGPMPLLANSLVSLLHGKSLLFGGVSLFAVMMIMFVLRIARDSELRTLKSAVKDLTARLSQADSGKEQVEKRLEQELKKTRELLEEKDSVVDELRDSLRRIHALTTELRETKGRLTTQDNELKTFSSEMNDHRGQLVEIGSSNGHANNLGLHKELTKQTEVLRAQESAIKEVEENLQEKIQALKGELGEKEKRLIEREGELNTLRAQMNDLTAHLAEMGSAKENGERLLREILRGNAEVLHAKECTINEIKETEESLRGKVQALEDELSEKKTLLKSQREELETLRSDMTRPGKLVEIGIAKAQAENASLKEELKTKTKALLEKNSTVKEIEETLYRKIQDLESLESEKEFFLQSHSHELRALRSEMDDLTTRLAEMTSAKENAESRFREILRENADLLQAKYFITSEIMELEERSRKKIQELEDELSEKRPLLTNREGELESLRSQLHGFAGKLAVLTSAKEHAEKLLHEELRNKNALLPLPIDSRVKEIEEASNEVIQTLKSHLREKDVLLENRDRQITKLSSELTAKKVLFAVQESEAWRSIGRRNVWKRRLAKFGIPG